MEAIHHFATIEQARNKAIEWLQARAVSFGPRRKVVIGRLGVMADSEVGVSADREPYWRLRLDYDPVKGPHFNAEFGKGSSREKAAFCFHGTQKLMESLRKRRQPR